MCILIIYERLFIKESINLPKHPMQHCRCDDFVIARGSRGFVALLFIFGAALKLEQFNFGTGDLLNNVLRDNCNVSFETRISKKVSYK